MFPGTCRSPWEQRCCSEPENVWGIQQGVLPQEHTHANLSFIRVMRKKSVCSRLNCIDFLPDLFNFFRAICCHFPPKNASHAKVRRAKIWRAAPKHLNPGCPQTYSHANVPIETEPVSGETIQPSQGETTRWAVSARAGGMVCILHFSLDVKMSARHIFAPRVVVWLGTVVFYDYPVSKVGVVATV